MTERLEDALERASAAVRSADALVISAGAGMGVDSGLPDFRGTQGFWRAYPPYAKLGLDFAAMANPAWFASDPTFAWGFYGHRMNLYRDTRPHHGFAILRRWADAIGQGAFVVTSNVDGQFQTAGFPPERVFEVHGSIHWMQCLRQCGAGIFPADEFRVDVDDTTFRAAEPLPACPRCGAVARPNVLMFGDYEWDGARATQQQSRLNAWLRSAAGAKVVILECGAGTAVPTIRHFSELAARQFSATLVRLNPREPQVPNGQIALALDACEALQAIDDLLAT